MTLKQFEAAQELFNKQSSAYDMLNLLSNCTECTIISHKSNTANIPMELVNMLTRTTEKYIDELNSKIAEI